MAAPQIPGPPPLPLVDAVLGGGGTSLADSVVGGPAAMPVPAPVPGVPDPAALELQRPRPTIHDGRAWINIGGEMFSVAPEQAEAAIAENPLSRFATPDEVDRRLAEKEQEGFIGGAKATGAALAEGLYSGLMVVPRGIASLGYAATGDEAYADVARAMGSENLFPQIGGTIEYYTGGGEAGEEAERSAIERARDAQRREWSNLTTIAESVGLIGGSALTALGGGAAVGGAARGLGIGSQALRTASAAELAFGGGIARQAAIAGAEGVLQGASMPFDDGGTPTQREILESALIGGALSAAIGGGVAGVANRLPDTRLTRTVARPEETLEELQAKVFSKKSTADAMADDIAKQVAPDAPPAAVRDAVEAKAYYDGLDAERRARIEAEAPNPARMRAASREATQEMAAKLDADKRAAGTIHEDNWKTIKPALRPLLKDEITEAAARDWERTQNALMRATDDIESFLDEAAQKVEKVRANFAADSIDDAAAMRAGEAALSNARSSFGDMLMQKSREVPLKKSAGKAARAVRPLEPDPEFWGPFKSRIKSIETTIKKADEAFRNANDAADSYIALDQARREIAAQVNGLAKSAASDNPTIADPARILRQWAQEEYLGRLVPHLSDARIYGKQGAAQSAVNLARRDVIQSGYLGDLSTIVTKSFGEPVRVADIKQARTMLQEIDAGQRSLKQDQLLKNYSALEDMARAVRAGYELTPKQAVAVDEMIQRAQAAREIMQTVDAQSSGLREKIVRALMGNVTGAAAGGLSGALVGGPVGAALGAGVLPIIQNSIKGVVRRVAVATAGDVTEKGAKRVAQKLAPEYRQSLNAKALGLSAVGTGLIFEKTRDKSEKERRKIYEARTGALAEITSNPSRAERAVMGTIGSIADKHPTMSGLMAMGMMGRARATMSEWPGKKKITPIPSQAQTTVSMQELRKSEAFWEALTDPMSVVTDFQEGNVDYDKVRFSQKLNPGLWQLYRAAVLDQLAGLPEGMTIPASTLTQLDMVMGFGGALSPTIAPDFSKRFDAYNEQLAQQSRPRPGANLNLPAAQPTHTQKIASGGRSA